MILASAHSDLMKAAPSSAAHNLYGVIKLGAYLLMMQTERAQLKVHNSAVVAVATTANAFHSPPSVPLFFVSTYNYAPIFLQHSFYFFFLFFYAFVLTLLTNVIILLVLAKGDSMAANYCSFPQTELIYIMCLESICH